MGPGNLPAVRIGTAITVQFGSIPILQPELLFLGGVVTQTGYKIAGLWLGWNHTVVQLCSSYNVGCIYIFEFISYHNMVYTKKMQF